MRGALLSILLLTVASAWAGTLEICRQKSPDKDDLRSCVEAERVRSTNQLRKTSLAARTAVNNKTQEEGSKSPLRTYRNLEARHVRDRNTHCRQHAEAIERSACEADMDKAQIEQLTRLIESLE